MSNAQHTPGPWRLGKRSDDVVADTPAGHPEDPESLEFYGGHLVAESIAQRNRRLIAAAPELLAFAQGFLADYQSEDGMASMKHYAKQAHALIAKATGEQA